MQAISSLLLMLKRRMPILQQILSAMSGLAYFPKIKFEQLLEVKRFFFHQFGTEDESLVASNAHNSHARWHCTIGFFILMPLLFMHFPINLTTQLASDIKHGIL